MKNSLLLLFFLLGGIITAQTTSTKSIQEKNYKLEYPTNWENSNAEQSSEGFFIFSEQENEDDIFRENINLQVEEFAIGLTLEEYAKGNIKKLEASMTGLNIIHNDIMVINDQVVYYLKYEGKMGLVNLTWNQYVFPHDKKLYTLSCAAETSKNANYEPTFTQIINSFIFTKNKAVVIKK